MLISATETCNSTVNPRVVLLFLSSKVRRTHRYPSIKFFFTYAHAKSNINVKASKTPNLSNHSPTMPSTLAVDGTLHECIVEYSAIVTYFSQSEDFANELLSYGTDEEYSDEVYTVVSNNAEHLSAIVDREFESVANLAIYILSLGPKSREHTQKLLLDLIALQELEPKLVKNKKKTVRVLGIVSVLSTVFNTSDDEQLKKWSLSRILTLVGILDDSALLKPFATNIEQILLSSSADEETRGLVLQTAELIAPENPLESLKLQKLAITKIPNPSAKVVDQFLVNSLNTSKALDLSADLADVSPLASQGLVEFTNAYLYTKFSEFSKLTAPTGVNAAAVNKKNQLLTLLSLASKSSTLSYSTIASELQIETTQVEPLLIDAVKLKIIEGKISQLDELFHVYRIPLIVKKIDLEDWKQVKNTVLAYKQNLQEVKLLLKQVKNRK